MIEQDQKDRIAKLKPLIPSSLDKAFPKNQELLNIMSTFFDLRAKRDSFIPEDKSRKLGIQFLDEATKDIKSVEILYSKKLYPHAVYHLQQAVEEVELYHLGERY